MLKRVISATLFTLSLGSTGCDSKAANNGNFKSAIQASYDKKPFCESSFGQLPVDLDSQRYGYKADFQKYEALKNAGLLVSQSSVKVLPDHSGAVFGITQHPRPVITYSIGGPNKSAWSSNNAICYAKVHVTSIDNFTEPSEMLGFKGSQVSYTYELTDVPSWAKDAEVQNVLPQMKTTLLQPTHQGMKTMVLTNNGWKTADDIR